MQALGVRGGHLRVDNAAPSRHPLHAAIANLTSIAPAVLVDNAAVLHIRQRLHTPMGVRRETAPQIFPALRAEFIEHEKRVHRRMPHAGHPLNRHAVSVLGRPGPAYLLYRTFVHTHCSRWLLAQIKLVICENKLHYFACYFR